MAVTTRSSRKAASKSDNNKAERMTRQNSTRPRRSFSYPSPATFSGAPSTTETYICVTQPSRDIAEARSKLMAAVSRALQELIEHDGYSRERATALLIRQIRREDEHPKDDDIFRLMSSSSNDLSRDDAATILTLTSALRRIRRENSISVVDAVDQLTDYFNCRMFSVRSQEQLTEVTDTDAAIKGAAASSGGTAFTSNVNTSFTKTSSSGPVSTVSELSKRTALVSSADIKSTYGKKSTCKNAGKSTSAVKRKPVKGFPNAPPSTIVSNDKTLPLNEEVEVAEKALKRKNLKGFTAANDENTPACVDMDVVVKEARMISESSVEQEKNIKTITNSLDQRLNRKRPADHLPSSSKRGRGTPEKA